MMTAALSLMPAPETQFRWHLYTSRQSHAEQFQRQILWWNRTWTWNTQMTDLRQPDLWCSWFR